MSDHNTIFDLSRDDKLPEELITFLNKTRDSLKGCERRLFMAQAVKLLGHGGQVRAQKGDLFLSEFLIWRLLQNECG